MVFLIYWCIFLGVAVVTQKRTANTSQISCFPAICVATRKNAMISNCGCRFSLSLRYFAPSVSLPRISIWNDNFRSFSVRKTWTGKKKTDRLSLKCLPFQLLFSFVRKKWNKWFMTNLEKEISGLNFSNPSFYIKFGAANGRKILE